MSIAKKNGNRGARSARGNPELARAKRILHKHLPELRERYSVKTLGVFGSYVRGEQKKKSDLDLLIEFEQTPTLLEFVHLKRHLGDLVGIPVDLVLKKTLKPHIGRYILAEVVPIA
ncbi:MAG: nucleotidyltransferase family protein [Chloroflexi bacterium]|nr:nucleotidyltransferase family protein [Chloroflexota bacterium]